MTPLSQHIRHFTYKQITICSQLYCVSYTTAAHRVPSAVMYNVWTHTPISINHVEDGYTVHALLCHYKKGLSIVTNCPDCSFTSNISLVFSNQEAVPP